MPLYKPAIVFYIHDVENLDFQVGWDVPLSVYLEKCDFETLHYTTPQKYWFQ